MSSFDVLFPDGDESHMARDWADDGAGELIISSRIAEYTVQNGIGKKKNIAPVTLQVALKGGSDADKFTFSWSWTAPCTILKHAAGPLALRNQEYLVFDADLASEDRLLGLSVPRHLGVDTKTLLEECRDLLDGSNCSAIPDSSRNWKSGSVIRLMIARPSHLMENETHEMEELIDDDPKADKAPSTSDVTFDN